MRYLKPDEKVLTRNNKIMKYRKLSFLFILNLSFTIIVSFGFWYLSENLTEKYNLQVDQNFNNRNVGVSQIQKVKFDLEKLSLKIEFSNQLFYFIGFVIISSSVFSFLKSKVDNENKRLDLEEKNTEN